MALPSTTVYLVMLHDDNYVLTHAHPQFGGVFFDLRTAIEAGRLVCAQWELNAEAAFKDPTWEARGSFRVMEIVAPPKPTLLPDQVVAYDSQLGMSKKDYQAHQDDFSFLRQHQQHSRDAIRAVKQTLQFINPTEPHPALAPTS